MKKYFKFKAIVMALVLTSSLVSALLASESGTPQTTGYVISLAEHCPSGGCEKSTCYTVTCSGSADSDCEAGSYCSVPVAGTCTWVQMYPHQSGVYYCY